jgi:hypothetical protein
MRLRLDNLRSHSMTHENTASFRHWFGIVVAIGIGIGFCMHRISIAIPIPIQNRADGRFILGKEAY